MKWAVYNFLVSCYFLGIKIAAIWRADARQWVNGRMDLFSKLQKEKSQKIKGNPSIVWVHVSSLGEFEQGRNLIEQLKKSYPELAICLSFFSPSGFEVRHNYSYADLVCYFPSDKPSDVKQFLNILSPTFVIFVKYDFWFNTLKELKIRNIPYFFISMNISKNSYLRKNICSSFLEELKNARHLFLQNEENYIFLKNRGFCNLSICGDTRLDRVLQIANEKFELDTLVQFFGDFKCLVLGSSWSQELVILQECMKINSLLDWKIIIAPHEIDENHLMEIDHFFPNQTSRLSHIRQESKILIIDRIGQLSRIYKYADLAFIGGGFGKGIHNTLEPAAFLCPMCFGPKYQKFQEAIDFVEMGAAKVIYQASDLSSYLETVEQLDECQKIKTSIQNWIEKQKGATERILLFLKKEILHHLP